MNVNELRNERQKLWARMKAINDKALAEKRDYTAEETQEWTRLDTEIEASGVQIARAEKMERRESELNSLESAPPRAEITDPEQSIDPKASHPRRQPAYRQAFGAWLADGKNVLEPKQYMALQSDSKEKGGYLVTPMQFVEELIKELNDLVFIREWATTHTVESADSLGAPSLDADPDDADWTAEIKTGSEDTAMKFGLRELHPHPLAKRIKVSRKLMRVSSMGVEQIVRERMGYKFAITHEKSGMTGSGANQMLGVFTASAQGIDTGRDVSDGNTTTAIGADGLINAKYSLKAPYQANARWIFHRTAVREIRKLKDGDGQYMWRAGLSTDRPDTILDLEFGMSEYAPSTFTTGLYVGIVGDFRFYWIADALGMEVQRVDELYAESNQIGFIGRLESDGAPVLASAFARVKLA